MKYFEKVKNGCSTILENVHNSVESIFTCVKCIFTLRKKTLSVFKLFFLSCSCMSEYRAVEDGALDVPPICTNFFARYKVENASRFRIILFVLLTCERADRRTSRVHFVNSTSCYASRQGDRHLLVNLPAKRKLRFLWTLSFIFRVLRRY